VHAATNSAKCWNWDVAGDWQAGGAVGYQGGGRTMNPRAGGAAAMRRNAPPPQERIRFEGPNWPFYRGNGDRLNPPPPGGWPVPTPPGGWQEGGVVDYASNFAAPWHRDAGEGMLDMEISPNSATYREEGFDLPTVDKTLAPIEVFGEQITDPREALMAERESLQQLLQQTTDEVMAQEILMQIREITKELDMDARNFGMANGGIASLMGI